MSKAIAALERAAAVPKPVAAPEEKITPSALWLALTAIPRPTKEVPLPRKIPGTDEPVGVVRMWPLTQEEQMAANADADRFTKALLKDPQRKEDANLGYHHTYTNEVAVQVLLRAARDPDDIKRPAFPSAGLLRQHLTTDEIGVLFSNYCTVQSELGPIRAQMSPEEADALILRLAEGGSTFPLDSYSWEQQRTLVVSMASRLVSCWTAMSSAGLPLELSSFAQPLLAERLERERLDQADLEAEAAEEAARAIAAAEARESAETAADPPAPPPEE